MSSCFSFLDFVMKFIYIFLPLQAILFRQEYLMFHDSNIYETAYPVNTTETCKSGMVRNWLSL